MVDIAENLGKIKNQIREYEINYHRKPESVFLLAASKGQSADKLQQAIDAGQLAFGENYLQEALEKQSILANQHIEWHFIGTIQSNKTKKIAEHFNWVHSVSDKRICERKDDQSQITFISCTVMLHPRRRMSSSPSILRTFRIVSVNRL